MRARQTSPRRQTLGPGALAGFALWQEAMRWQRGIDRALRGIGLTHTQLLVLGAIERTFVKTSESATQADIAREANLDTATTSAIVRALEKRGLVTRDVGHDDRRSWWIAMSPAGHRALEAASPLAEEVGRQVPPVPMPPGLGARRR
jgi:DNA-binding MarR family transcriptional regulator